MRGIHKHTLRHILISPAVTSPEGGIKTLPGAGNGKSTVQYQPERHMTAPALCAACPVIPLSVEKTGARLLRPSSEET
jgi:hypothetical protein